MNHGKIFISRDFAVSIGVAPSVLAVAPAHSQGANPEEIVLAIAVESRERGRGFGNFTDLIRSDFQLGADIDEAEFTQTGLRRVS